MKKCKTIFFTGVMTISLGLTPFGLAQSTSTLAPANANAFEELPELKASDILKPEFLKGAHHSVQESVPTASGANHFVIDSDFGQFEADGNEMLVIRVKEVYAIADLKEVSRTDQFKDSLSNAAKGTLNAAKNIVTDPGQSLSNVPKGVMKFMGRAGQSVKNIGKKKEDDGMKASQVEKVSGQSNAKRKIAFSMGVDPYSTNAVLQKQLDDIAWASWAGGFLFKAGTMPISGPVGAALTVTSVSGSLDKIVQEKPPADLRQMNRASLRGMGVGDRDTENFLSNPAFSPTQQTAFVLNLKALDGVANRAAFVRSATENSDSEGDAMFCVLTSALMSKIHQGDTPLARIAMIDDFPACVARDGKVVLALQWDYAAWTAAAAAVAAEAETLAQTSGNKGALIALSGESSARLKEELKARGFTVRDRVNPGPLK
jgi:hypothetical protein